MLLGLVSDSEPQTTPSCPTCGSTEHLWDHNFDEGCHRCGYRGEGSRIVEYGSIERALEFDRKQANKE